MTCISRPAILRHDDQLHPPVRELLRVPPFVVDGFDATIRTLRLVRLGKRDRDAA